MFNSDKIIVAITVCFLLVGYFFSKEIIKDVKLFYDEEIIAVSEKKYEAYFLPITTEEKIEIFEDFVKKIKVFQAKVANSWFARFFLDFPPEDIAECEREIELLKEHFKELLHARAFLTRLESTIVTELPVGKKDLLELSSLIDEFFPNDSETAVYELVLNEKGLALFVQPLGNHENIEKKRFQDFINQVSGKIFKEPVFLHVCSADTDFFVLASE